MSTDCQLWCPDVRTGSKSVRDLLVEEMPTAALMIVCFCFFFCLFFCLYHNTQHGKVMHKGPGEKGNREGDVLGFPGATECREDEEEHFGRHS